MKYSGGEACANGIRRSVDVHVSCGLANEVVAVEEDGMCIYTMWFRTPLLCGNAAGGMDDDDDDDDDNGDEQGEGEERNHGSSNNEGKAQGRPERGATGSWFGQAVRAAVESGLEWIGAAADGS